MKLLAPLVLLLASCQSAAAPTDEQLAAQLRERAVAFLRAMDHGDLDRGLELAATEARGFFEAERRFRALMLRDEAPESGEQAVEVAAAERDGARGVVVLQTGVDDTRHTMAVHLLLEGDTWGVVGFSPEPTDEPRRFRDMEDEAKQRLAQALNETAPHPELGPVIEAYFAAAAAVDGLAMAALMTDECRRSERRDAAFTTGFLNGRFVVQRWQFARHDVAGDDATQHVRTILQLADGQIDAEPMRFQLRRKDGGWWIAAIR